MIYKEGDKVKIIQDTSEHKLKNGDVLTIKNATETFYRFKENTREAYFKDVELYSEESKPESIIWDEKLVGRKIKAKVDSPHGCGTISKGHIVEITYFTNSRIYFKNSYVCGKLYFDRNFELLPEESTNQPISYKLEDLRKNKKVFIQVKSQQEWNTIIKLDYRKICKSDDYAEYNSICFGEAGFGRAKKQYYLDAKKIEIPYDKFIEANMPKSEDKWTKENIIGVTFTCCSSEYVVKPHKTNSQRCIVILSDLTGNEGDWLKSALTEKFNSGVYQVISQEPKTLKKEDLYNCKLYIGDSLELREKVLSKLLSLGFHKWTTGKSNTDYNAVYLYTDDTITGHDRVTPWEFKSNNFHMKVIYLSDLGIEDEIKIYEAPQNNSSSYCIGINPYKSQDSSEIVIKKVVKQPVNTQVRVSTVTNLDLKLPKVETKKVKRIVISNFSLSI